VNKQFRLPSEQLFELVNDTRERTLELVADLVDEQLLVRKMEIVNPFRWELGHVAFFYDVFPLRVLGSDKFLLEGAENLYDSFKVEDRLGAEPNPWETYLYLLSVLHEDMHGEAFTYMRQTLEYPEPQLGIFQDKPKPAEIGGGALAGDGEIPGGTFQLGATPDLPFVFDNEKWAHPVEVPAFRMARSAVTNAEFAEFVEDRGYLRRELWSHQGWLWRTKTGSAHPICWQRGGSGWLRRHFDKLVPLEEHCPVIHVSWYEAEAYCNWAGRRLPTEEEWEMAASAEPAPDGKGITELKRRYPWGDEPPTSDRANLDSRFLGHVDVGAFPYGDSAFGCRQMMGNIWEWTGSAFYPFPGYTVDGPYREYSAPWFGYPKVLKGGAWATRSRLACNTYRNFFQPYRRDIFAGFRSCAI
jgi:iron(II)-dependent oxidoreductase